ncbi:hypothetical protein BC826DRAFT_622585 [Russula brevipes]|nr:hypothetical protein BC826DRAFT_622585 [Russula brevipes]
MQHPHRRLIRRQVNDVSSIPAVSGVSGITTAVTGDDLPSSLLLGTSDSYKLTASKTFSLDTATSTQTGTTSPSSPLTNPSSLSTGAVMGITVSVFLVVVAAMFALYRHFTQRTTPQARLARAPGPPSLVRLIAHVRDHSKDKQWNRKEDRGDRGEHKDRSPLKADNLTVAACEKTPESRDLRLFEKDPSDRSVSDEKANASDNHSFDPSAMPNFAAHHLELTDNLYALPPPRPFVARGEGSPAISWDGETVNGDPFLSQRADAVSPTTVMARQTPQTTDSAQHHWESAEVLIMDGPATERPSVYSETSQDPFDNSSNPRPSIGDSSNSDPRSGNNPFFNASQHNPFADRTTRSRKSSVSTARRSRSNSASSAGTARPGGALLSLIAALDTTPIVADDLASRTSMHTATSSIYSPTEGVVPETPKAL